MATTEPTTLANAVMPGAGYVTLSRRVDVPCIITISAGEPHRERVPVYRCAQDGPYVAWLGVDDPGGRPLDVQLERFHSAGALVRVEAAAAKPEDEAPGAAFPDLVQQIRNRLAPVPTVDEWGQWMRQTRDAILAVVDYATPGEPFPGEGDSRDHSEKATDAEVEAVRAHVLGLIAEGLGLEVADG